MGGELADVSCSSHSLTHIYTHTHTHTNTHLYTRILATDTAYCKNKETGKWYNFDNSHVSEMTEDHVIVRLVPESISW